MEPLLGWRLAEESASASFAAGYEAAKHKKAHEAASDGAIEAESGFEEATSRDQRDCVPCTGQEAGYGAGLGIVDAAKQTETVWQNLEAAIAAAEPAADAQPFTELISMEDVSAGARLDAKTSAARRILELAEVMKAAREGQAAKAAQAVKEEEERRKKAIEEMESAKSAIIEEGAKWRDAMIGSKMRTAGFYDVKSIHEAGWKAEDSMSIVPLHRKARSGAMDMITEEGLISAGE